MYYERALNSAGALLVLLTYVAIQVVYCHYMLTPCVECLWYVKILAPLFEARRSVDRMIDQRASYGTEKKRSLVQQNCVYTAIAFIVRKNWTHMPSTSGSYSRLTGRRNWNELQNF